MLPVTFEEQNLIFVKPGDMTEEQCGSLPVWAGKDADGVPVIISCWQPSREDLQELMETGRLWLVVTGSVQPPVRITTENPFGS